MKIAPVRTIAAFLRLSQGDRRLVIRCWCLLVSATFGVRLRPLKNLIEAIDERVARRGQRDGTPEDALRLCAVAARRVWPRPTCLVTALAGYEVLQERGWQVALVIGGHSKGADFKAHAWLECDDVVVLGAPTGAYRPIWRWSAGTVALSQPQPTDESWTARRDLGAMDR